MHMIRNGQIEDIQSARSEVVFTNKIMGIVAFIARDVLRDKNFLSFDRKIIMSIIIQ